MDFKSYFPVLLMVMAMVPLGMFVGLRIGVAASIGTAVVVVVIMSVYHHYFVPLTVRSVPK